ncbi:hypothetical protein ACHAW5_006976 [Stephanodiscus triporus]|uniref:Histidinol dehydrogenase n=1 Tax=Stephanodiscus triporus TaxID=2934178 RepID=A0ABD3NMK0_9STRA
MHHTSTNALLVLLVRFLIHIHNSSTAVIAFSSTRKRMMLTRRTPQEVQLEIKDPVDPDALLQSRAILDELRSRPSSSSSSSSSVGGGHCSSDALLAIARRFGDVVPPSDDDDDESGGCGYVVPSSECRLAYESLTDDERRTLANVRDRVRAFAEAQRRSVVDVEVDIPGGKAGHTVSPCRVAGCYAPGGRYPLPSSVIMTVVTARAAGCPYVVLCSPRPAPITLAAAYVSGADLVLSVGGAQAIGAMAYGVATTVRRRSSSPPPDDDDSSFEEEVVVVVPPCDVIVGPGNRWVTAAKSIVSGRCGIDMLAGPSEVLVIADSSADPIVVASDLIAQAEHDVVARAILVSDDPRLIDEVDIEVARQVDTLPEPNRSTASEALRRSFAVLCSDVDECVSVSDRLAPEHLEVHTRDPTGVGMRCANYGGLFVGPDCAEVLGDYGAGPNHTLPTGGTGRYTGGLSVFNFLRIRTWMRIDDGAGGECQDMVEDCVRMARLEGLEGHARAAERRRR